MRQDRPYRIGLHAPRNAGKTCLFACLYGLRQLLLDEVAFDNDETLTYLKSIWRYLKDGSVPPATAMTKPTELGWRLRSGGDAWDLLTCDYPGALVEPAATGGAARELKDEARAWFRSCDALLVLVDSSAPDVEQVDVVDILLRELRNESRDRRAVSRPLALVLTKWDTHGPISPSREEEQDRLQKYLVNNSVFERIGRTLREAGGRFSVFAISAFGKPCPKPGVAPPTDEMKPFQLLLPWKWAAAQCATVAETQRRKRMRRRWRQLIAVTAFIVAIGTGGYVYGSRQAERQFADLNAFRMANPGETTAADRLARDDRFLESWCSWMAPNNRTIVRGWRDADFAVAEKIRIEEERAERARKHSEAYQRTTTAVGRLSKFSGKEPETYEAYKKFLDEFPESEYAAEFRKAQLLVRDTWDDRLWRELEEFAKRHGTPIELKKRAEEYLDIPGASKRIDARMLLGRADGELDKAEYDDLRKLSQSGTDGAGLETMDNMAKRYLDEARTIKKMVPAVKAWHDWFEALHRDGQYTIRVKSVSIPPKGELESLWGMQPRVVITLGKTTHKTEMHNGYSPSILEDLGPFAFKWGNPNRLVVRVENDYWYRSNPGIENPMIDEKFILGKANGRVTINDDLGKVTVVELECKGAVPPFLPEYQ